MNQTKREIELIRDSMETLSLRLISPIRPTEEGYEVIINLEEKFIPKKDLRKMLEGMSLKVSEIDTLNDSLGPYAYAIISRDSKYLHPIGAEESDTLWCKNSGDEIKLCSPLMDDIFFDIKLRGNTDPFALNYKDGKLASLNFRGTGPCFCPYCGTKLMLAKQEPAVNVSAFESHETPREE